jgi:hypothetical protein
VTTPRTVSGTLARPRSRPPGHPEELHELLDEEGVATRLLVDHRDGLVVHRTGKQLQELSDLVRAERTEGDPHDASLGCDPRHERRQRVGGRDAAMGHDEEDAGTGGHPGQELEQVE